MFGNAQNYVSEYKISRFGANASAVVVVAIYNRGQISSCIYPLPLLVNEYFTKSSHTISFVFILYRGSV